MAEQFYWRSKICMYECKLKISFNYGVFKCCSLKNTFKFYNDHNLIFSETSLKFTEISQYILK